MKKLTNSTENIVNYINLQWYYLFNHQLR